MPTEKSQAPKLIKKYANRRLYDTEKSRYITLADLTLMAREHTVFVVEDARTGENITRQILVQIISDHEVSEETSMMSVEALREVVSLYVPSPMNRMFIDYLGNALANFMRQQSGLQKHLDGLFSEFSTPTAKGGQPTDQQLKMWNSMTEIFSPQSNYPESNAEPPLTHPETDSPSTAAGLDKSDRSKQLTAGVEPAYDPELKRLKAEMAALQKKVDQLAGK